MKLLSNFTDFYDASFISLPGSKTLYRHTESGLLRRGIFKFLDSLHITTPLHGIVTDVIDQIAWEYSDTSTHILDYLFEEDIKLIVYTDEKKHRGEGKLLKSVKDAVKEFPNNYCSQYIKSDVNGFARSLRYLQIGKCVFWMEYVNKLKWEWRSNWGDKIEINLLPNVTPYDNTILVPNIPLCAIDFVVADKLYAVDYNIAPGIKGTGIEDILTGKEVAQLIAQNIGDN